MNEFWFVASTFGFTVAVCAVWVMGKVIFERWLNNDWCRHNWGMWETKEENKTQMRFCKKCNMMERRVP
jgi:hypothetical protein